MPDEQVPAQATVQVHSLLHTNLNTIDVAASAAFSPYGGVTASSGSMPALGYQDQYTDPSTGDTDMSARWYAPSTGTFTSSDSTSTGMPDPSPLTPTPYAVTTALASSYRTASFKPKLAGSATSRSSPGCHAPLEGSSRAPGRN